MFNNKHRRFHLIKWYHLPCRFSDKKYHHGIHAFLALTSRIDIFNQSYEPPLKYITNFIISLPTTSLLTHCTGLLPRPSPFLLAYIIMFSLCSSNDLFIKSNSDLSFHSSHCLWWIPITHSQLNVSQFVFTVRGTVIPIS